VGQERAVLIVENGKVKLLVREGRPPLALAVGSFSVVLDDLGIQGWEPEGTLPDDVETRARYEIPMRRTRCLFRRS
jgi:hypothetical protein